MGLDKGRVNGSLAGEERELVVLSCEGATRINKTCAAASATARLAELKKARQPVKTAKAAKTAKDSEAEKCDRCKTDDSTGDIVECEDGGGQRRDARIRFMISAMRVGDSSFMA